MRKWRLSMSLRQRILNLEEKIGGGARGVVNTQEDYEAMLAQLQNQHADDPFFDARACYRRMLERGEIVESRPFASSMAAQRKVIDAYWARLISEHGG